MSKSDDLLTKLAKYGVPAELLCQVAARFDLADKLEQRRANAVANKHRQRAVSQDILGRPRTSNKKPNEINGELFSTPPGEKERKEEKGLPHTPSKEKKRKKEDISTILGFDAFWGAYPRRVAKLAAVRAYKKALANGAEPSVLEASARRYGEACKGKEEEFIAHPSTWLNAGRWLDGQEFSVGQENERRLKQLADEETERRRKEREQHLHNGHRITT